MSVVYLKDYKKEEPETSKPPVISMKDKSWGDFISEVNQALTKIRESVGEVE
jgi:hypothetical protein